MFATVVTHIALVTSLVMAILTIKRMVQTNARLPLEKGIIQTLALLGVVASCLGFEAARSGFTNQPPRYLFSYLISAPEKSGPGTPSPPPPPSPSDLSKAICDRYCDEIESLHKNNSNLSQSDYCKQIAILLVKIDKCKSLDDKYYKTYNKFGNILKIETIKHDMDNAP